MNNGDGGLGDPVILGQEKTGSFIQEDGGEVELCCNIARITLS